MEWLAFDFIEPINPAGMILRGLAGPSKSSQPQQAMPAWKIQKNQMLSHFAMFGKKKKV